LRSSMAPRSRKLSNVGQSVGWVAKTLLSLALRCFGRHVKPLVPAAFAIVSIHQPALGSRGARARAIARAPYV
jgi:hypothetical protein